MPIVGLNTTAQLPLIGRWFKGAKKTDPKRPGKDLDYLRLEAAPDVAKEVFDALGTDKPRELRIMLTRETAVGNFDPWMIASSATGLNVQCDKQFISRKRVAGRVQQVHEDCKFDAATGKCPLGCKPSGELVFMLRGVKRSGVFRLRMTSWADAAELSRNLAAAEQLSVILNGIVRGEAVANLIGIEFVLRRVEKEISVPSKDSPSGRARSKRWLLQLEVSPEFLKRVLEQAGSRAMGDALALPAPAMSLAEAVAPASPKATLKRPTEDTDADVVSSDLADDDEDDEDDVIEGEEGDDTPHAIPTEEQKTRVSALVTSLDHIREQATSVEAKKGLNDALRKTFDGLVEQAKARALATDAFANPASFDAAMTNASALANLLVNYDGES